MKLNPYLTFDGNAHDAIAFYCEVLDATVAMSQTFGEMPDQDWVKDDMKDRLAHATLVFGDNSLLLSDTAGHQPFEGYNGVTLQLSVASLEEGTVVFNALSEGGKVDMPFAKTFWAEGFGMCHDKFGVAWMVNVDAS